MRHVLTQQEFGRLGTALQRGSGVFSVDDRSFLLTSEGYREGSYDAPTKKFTAFSDTLENIEETPSVISSEDLGQTYKQDSDTLDEIIEGFEQGETETKTEAEKRALDTGVEDKSKVEKTETTGDPLIDAYNVGIDRLQESINESNRIARERAESEKRYYDTSLAALDATVAATIARIGATYDKRISEQERINQLNIDRVKAYGLAGSGRFTPISFGDAISGREQAAADKIAELESQRNAFLAEARAARDAGEAGLLRDRMDNLNTVEDNLRKQINEAEKAAEAQYKLFREFRQAEETKHKEKLEELRDRFISQLSPSLVDEYEGKSDEEKKTFIEDLQKKGWGDFLFIYSTLENAITEKSTAGRKVRKEEASIDATRALAEQRRREGGMAADVTESFQSKEDFNSKQREFIKKHGEKGKKYWDAIFLDEFDEYVYETASGDDEETKAKNASIGDIVTIDGVKHKKVGDDDFVPE